MAVRSFQLLIASIALLGVAASTQTLLGQLVQGADKVQPKSLVTPVEFGLSDQAENSWATDTLVSANLNDDAAKTPAAEPAVPQESTACCPAPKNDKLDKAARTAYKGLFYDNNFDYLCNPCYQDWHLGESLKRLGFGDSVIFDLGGQFRMRQHSERNMRGLGLTGRDDDFLLYRTRLYSNVEIGRRFRVYAEMIDANSEYENYLPRPIEVNRMDMLNLFGDVMLLDRCRGELWARVGRQELLYGDQRAISPLDWANTRRTFDGAKVFWRGQNWDIDAFYVRPVFPNATHFDNPNYDREFMGLYATYKDLKYNKVDVYYLAYNNNVDHPGNFNYDTFGSRLKGGRGAWLWDLEGAYQSGNFNGHNHDAGFYTLGLGRKFEHLLWKPTLWAYYDWASGDDEIGNGYDHMFPLAHKYMGFMDLYGRRNLKDMNLLLTMNPHQKVKLLMWYHIFHLENMNDVPYSVVMTPFNAGNLPRASALGQELDTVVSWTISPRTNLLFGYSQFFAGDYYHKTPGVPYDGDASFFYTQFTVNF